MSFLSSFSIASCEPSFGVAVAYQDHHWDASAPGLTYSGASSPASSASSPRSVESESFVPAPRKKASSPPRGHIPRPRNAFIIFRSHFYAREKATQSDINQNDLSCAAAVAWKNLPESEKNEFRQQAEEEKIMHYQKHPGYVYAPAGKAVKRPQKKTKAVRSAKQQPAKTKKHRSSLSQTSMRAESLDLQSAAPRHVSTESDSCSQEFDPLKQTEAGDADGESQNWVDPQFGHRVDNIYSELPPTPTIPETDIMIPNEYAASPVVSEPVSGPEPSPQVYYNNYGYPIWMYDELLGAGTPDAGTHADWNPLQATLNTYGDNHLYDGHVNGYDEFSQYVNYDNVDTTSAAGYYSFGQTPNPDGASAGYLYLNNEGAWVGV